MQTNAVVQEYNERHPHFNPFPFSETCMLPVSRMCGELHILLRGSWPSGHGRVHGPVHGVLLQFRLQTLRDGEVKGRLPGGSI
jgi:RNA 3'-terminal phosphate cyclase